MSKVLLQQVKQVRTELTAFHKRMVQLYGGEGIVNELMIHRKYKTDVMFDVLMDIGIFKVDSITDISLMFPDITNEQLQLWGLVTADNQFLLSGRYVLPIRETAGEVIALVGWHPLGGSRKYVTTPTLGFSRDTSFFNIENAYKLSHEKWGGVVYLLEGIFDTLALRAIGLPAIGMQGLEMSPFKSAMLTRFNLVVALPDNDRSGMGVNPFLNKASGKRTSFIWNIPVDYVFGILPQGIKDSDDFVNDFDCFEELVKLQSSRFIRRIKDEDA